MLGAAKTACHGQLAVLAADGAFKVAVEVGLHVVVALARSSLPGRGGGCVSESDGEHVHDGAIGSSAQARHAGGWLGRLWLEGVRERRGGGKLRGLMVPLDESLDEAGLSVDGGGPGESADVAVGELLSGGAIVATASGLGGRVDSCWRGRLNAFEGGIEEGPAFAVPRALGSVRLVGHGIGVGEHGHGIAKVAVGGGVGEEGVDLGVLAL